MKLVVMPPIAPMLAKRADEIPDGVGWMFEPKWDGFRALIFRDASEILIQSRDAKSLNRYFPDLIFHLQSQLPARCILDGEIVIVTDSGLDFDALQLRIHPAQSRVRQLAARAPASMVFFDLLCAGERDWRNEPFVKRRKKLESLLKHAAPPLHVTPATRDRKLACDWFRRFEGAGLDGVMAKPESLTYKADTRAMLKIKHERDCDCVVGGFRWRSAGQGSEVGSLLLGLYDSKGALHHVGICAGFSQAKRLELARLLRPYRRDASKKHPWIADSHANAKLAGRIPGGQSRWSHGKNLSWVPLRPELVAEVTYDHMQGNRFRHVAQFCRWRPDKRPQDCTYAQLETIPPEELKKIFSRGV